MKRTIGLVLFLLFAVQFMGCKRNDRQTRPLIYIHAVTISPGWESSEVIRLETVKSTSIVRKSGVKSFTSKGEVELHIVKVGGNEWRCSWRITDIKNSRGNSVLSDGLDGFLKIFSYDFVLDSRGIFKELVNWKDIQCKGIAAIDSIQKELENNAPGDAALMANLLIEKKKMLESKEVIEDNFLQDARLFFALGGVEAVKGDTLEGLLPIACPLNIGPIIQPVFITLESAYSDSSCDILVANSIDMLKLGGALHRYAEKESRSSEAPNLTGEFGEEILSSGTVVLFNISLKTGLVESAVSVKRVMLDDVENIEMTEIRRVRGDS